MNRRFGNAQGLPKISFIPDICPSFPSVANFELCEPVKKKYPLLKTLVSRLTFQRSQAGNLSRSLSELRNCPSLGEKPTCVARCYRSVKNTIKNTARVCHIDIMQVNPILGHFGTLEAKKRGHFPQKKRPFCVCEGSEFA